MQDQSVEGLSCSWQGRQQLKRKMKNHKYTVHQTVWNCALAITVAAMATQELRLTLSPSVTQVWRKTSPATHKNTQKHYSLFEKEPFGLGLVLPPLVHSVPHPSTHTHTYTMCTHRGPIVLFHIVAHWAEWHQRDIQYTHSRDVNSLLSLRLRLEGKYTPTNSLLCPSITTRRMKTPWVIKGV